MTIRRCVTYRNDLRGTLEVKGKGPTKVMHPHTKYNLPIWKDKTVMVWTSFAEKKQKRKKKKSD
jgi:hypothetical protein